VYSLKAVLMLQMKSSQLSFAQLDRLGRMMEGVNNHKDLQRFVEVHSASGGGQATPMRSTALRLMPIGIDDLVPTRLNPHLPAPSSPVRREGSTSSAGSLPGEKSPTSTGPVTPDRERRERAASLSLFGSHGSVHEEKPAYDDKEVRTGRDCHHLPCTRSQLAHMLPVPDAARITSHTPHRFYVL
jgi:hypothetical protein